MKRRMRRARIQRSLPKVIARSLRIPRRLKSQERKMIKRSPRRTKRRKLRRSLRLRAKSPRP